MTFDVVRPPILHRVLDGHRLPRAAAATKLALVGLGKKAEFKPSSAKKWGEFIGSCAKAEKAKTAAAILPFVGEGPFDATMQQVERVQLARVPIRFNEIPLRMVITFLRPVLWGSNGVLARSRRASF